jgi:hypothetical protein
MQGLVAAPPSQVLLEIYDTGTTVIKPNLKSFAQFEHIAAFRRGDGK